MSVYYCFGVDGRRENLSERMQKRISVEEALILTPVQHHILILFAQCSFAEMETITVKNGASYKIYFIQRTSAVPCLFITEVSLKSTIDRARIWYAQSNYVA